MFVRIYNYLTEWYQKTVTSIGFLPTLISLAYGIAAGLLVELDTSAINTFLMENRPNMFISEGDTARVILSTIVGGLVSLMVFSFTMVMGQLNRAAVNYSPRLLPGLISTRSHQVVLGVMLGTIVFCLLILISIEPEDGSPNLPGLAILISVVMGLSCLAVFVYFIHNISQAIQVTNILQRVADETEQRLKVLDASDERHDPRSDVDLESPCRLDSPRTGYYQGCHQDSLMRIARAHDLVIRVRALQGDYVLEGTRFLEISSEPDDSVRDEILSCFQFSGDEFARTNYVLGFKQIAEIAVRAMSPGTNDPGTALNAIDHLTHLFGLRMRLDDHEIYSDDEGNVRLVVEVARFAGLLYLLHSSLRQYCKHDVVIVLKLIQMFDFLLQRPAEVDSYHTAIVSEVNNLYEDALASISNEEDRRSVQARIQRLARHIEKDELKEKLKLQSS